MPVLEERWRGEGQNFTSCEKLQAQGHAAAALALWRNMLEPFGSKTKGWGDQENLKCPTK
ncbi:unnamed protein product, partial [Porites evermanni]